MEDGWLGVCIWRLFYYKVLGLGPSPGKNKDEMGAS